MNSNYRALIKKVETIPNVSEFYTFKYSVDEYALIYGIEKVLRKIEVKAHTNGKSNKYLLKQFTRLSKYAIEGDKEAYAELSDRLMRKSISFRIVAMNRKFKDWFLVDSRRKLRAIWRNLGGIIQCDSGDIDFKRVWIDKKPKDFARPLGVPTMEWRIFSWMKMEIIERYLKGAGKLAPWQHGGRSGVGVLSCWKELLPRMQSSMNIYEFDIKGFFDNISHKSINSEFSFELGFMSDWIKRVLQAKVKGYVLPPREEDPALRDICMKDKYEIMMEIPETGMLHSPNRAFDWQYELPKGAFKATIEIPEAMSDYDFYKATGETVRNTWSYYDQDPYVEDEMNRAEESPHSPNKAFDWQYELPPKLDERQVYEKGLRKEALKRDVEELLEESGDSVGIGLLGLIKQPEILERKVMSDKERAQARERWKKLAQAGKGVPQGLGTSPLISTFMTDMRFTELKNNILMYMDDGLLFADTQEEMKRVIKELKASLRMMGLSIAKEKSGWIKQEGNWINKEPKFLGMRYLVEENTIMSDTRSGTKVKFPMIGEWPKIAALAAYNKLSIPYMRKKFDVLLQTKSWEAGVKYGFLGCLIAEATYKDAPPMWVRKLEVKRGQKERLSEIERNKQGYLWRSGELENWTGSIHSITSIASARMLNKRTRTKVLKYGAVGRGRKLLRSSTTRK